MNGTYGNQLHLHLRRRGLLVELAECAVDRVHRRAAVHAQHPDPVWLDLLNASHCAGVQCCLLQIPNLIAVADLQ